MAMNSVARVLRPRMTLILAAFLIAPAAQGAGAVSGTNARIRLAARGMPVAGFLDISNDSGHPVVLKAVHGPAFRRIVVLGPASDGKLRPVKGLRIQPGQKLQFGPKGYQLKMWPLEPLATKATTPVSFEFKNGKAISVTFRVGGPAED